MKIQGPQNTGLVLLVMQGAGAVRMGIASVRFGILKGTAVAESTESQYGYYTM